MLTRKEQEILKLRKQGSKQRVIAEKLGISQAAVSNFERNAKRKIREAEDVLRFADKYGLRKSNDTLIRESGGEPN